MIFRQNTWDRDIFNTVVQENEYRIDPTTIPKDGVILDIGAHIGSFSYMMSRHVPNGRIQAYEAHPGNYDHCFANLSPIPNATVQHLAVTAVDDDKVWIPKEFPPGNATGVNTGGLSIVRDQFFEDKAQVDIVEKWDPDDAANGIEAMTESIAENKAEMHEVKTICLATILEDFARVHMIKFDCEGSEFEILRACPTAEMAKVDCIVGEYHIFNETDTKDALQAILEGFGFTVTFRMPVENLGFFTATRVDEDPDPDGQYGRGCQ
jgi:FkbM family methyltransferase